jgi:hypothetical protein
VRPSGEARLSGKRQSLTLGAAAIALAMIPAACKPPASEPSASEPSAPAMEFLTDTFDPADLAVPIEEADEHGVDLNVSGLCAIDKDVAYLFGGLDVAPGALRSFMLQTTDGGKTWHEVMSPVVGSEVTNVAFSDHQHGWALVMWTVEGPGALVLFGSTDEGKTWRQLTEIERSPGHAVPDGYPVSMIFKSALKGEIELSYDDTREIEKLASGDGGRTWSMVRRETRVEPPMDDRCFDSADWELTTRGLGESMTVRRFDREQKLWRVTTLPTHFKYERRRVVASR